MNGYFCFSSVVPILLKSIACAHRLSHFCLFKAEIMSIKLGYNVGSIYNASIYLGLRNYSMIANLPSVAF